LSRVNWQATNSCVGYDASGRASEGWWRVERGAWPTDS
jgi:hypothetical protein